MKYPSYTAKAAAAALLAVAMATPLVADDKGKSRIPMSSISRAGHRPPVLPPARTCSITKPIRP